MALVSAESGVVRGGGAPITLEPPAPRMVALFPILPDPLERMAKARICEVEPETRGPATGIAARLACTLAGAFGITSSAGAGTSS